MKYNKCIGGNLSFGQYESNAGNRYVLGLLIEDFALNRSQIFAIYSACFTDVGIALEPHAEYGQMLTMDFCINQSTSQNFYTKL